MTAIRPLCRQIYDQLFLAIESGAPAELVMALNTFWGSVTQIEALDAERSAMGWPAVAAEPPLIHHFGNLMQGAAALMMVSDKVRLDAQNVADGG